jgi:2,3-dihydroxybenzoate-AMP ligase
VSHLDGFVPFPDDVAARHRAAGYWTGDPLDSILRGGAREAGDRIAVVDRERRVTYAELDAKVDRVAAALRALGLRSQDRVIVQLPNVLELVETLFALFRLGAIPILALPGHRASDISQFAQIAGARAYVIADRLGGFDYRGLARAVQPGSTIEHVIVVGEPDGFVAYASLDAEPADLPAVDASQVALLQLSGGSTGTPKLIARTHDDYLYSVRGSVPICGLTPDSRYLVALPGSHNFTLSSAGILGALVARARVVMCIHPHPDHALPLLEREAITITALVPPLARIWTSAARSRGVRLPALQVIQVGGAKLAPEVAREILETFGCQLQQVFGMAEGLVCYTRLGDPGHLVTETQGRPISPADEVRIVDDVDQDVADGAVGHLLTRGPYTIRGYFRADEHNRRAFTADGFYRTGDRVRRTPEGYLVVEGRAKEQINRGGEKIAPVELEEHLAGHPSVREAVVVGVPDLMLGERICAAVVAHDGAAIRQPEIVAFLRRRGVAEFKLPDRVEVVAAIPRTSVGKIDRNGLVRQLLDARGAR